MKKDKTLREQAGAERAVAARSGLGVVLAGLVVVWVVLRWIRHG
jgi:hypothetical protein